MLVPLVKMSYHIEKGLPDRTSTHLLLGLPRESRPRPCLGLPQNDSTLLINIFDALGGLVTLSYTVAVCLPPDGRSRKGK